VLSARGPARSATPNQAFDFELFSKVWGHFCPWLTPVEVRSRHSIIFDGSVKYFVRLRQAADLQR